MAGNSLGQLLRITNFGESHGKALGVVIDGCPPLLSLGEEDIQSELDRRLPGQSEITTQRKEDDRVQILSGVLDGKTTGAPICLIIQNKDARMQDYKEIKTLYRPSHADFTYEAKYGIRDASGGGRSSARITAGNVAAGAVARKILSQSCNVEIVAYVKKIRDIGSEADPCKVKREDVEATIVRCPDKRAAGKMIELIKKARDEGDSLGGIIECVVRNVPSGLGDPIFDKLEADLGKAMLCINATKGFEIGSGFAGTEMNGRAHNDAFVSKKGKIMTLTNNSGGVQGGISNGMPIVFRVAFKPTSTIMKEQKTVDRNGKAALLSAKGRHDPCVLPRAVPIVEAMAALVLCDHYLRQKVNSNGH